MWGVLQPLSLAISIITESFTSFTEITLIFYHFISEVITTLYKIVFRCTQHNIQSVVLHVYIITYNHWTKTINTPEQNCSNVLPLFCFVISSFFLLFSSSSSLFSSKSCITVVVFVYDIIVNFWSDSSGLWFVILSPSIANTHTHTHTCIHTHTHACTHTYTHMHAHTHTLQTR